MSRKTACWPCARPQAQTCSYDALLTATHAVFGLLNATPHIAAPDQDRLREVLVALALGAVDALTEAAAGGA